MKIKPIIFNTEGAKAILEERKTQTRRIIKPQPKYTRSITQSVLKPEEWALSGTMGTINCPYGKVGDKLLVMICDTKINEEAYGKLTNLKLEITDIRIERLQEISERDCLAEGLIPDFIENGYMSYLDQRERMQLLFEKLWDSIYGKDAWDRNDWCWCISFKRIDK